MTELYLMLTMGYNVLMIIISRYIIRGLRNDIGRLSHAQDKNYIEMRHLENSMKKERALLDDRITYESASHTARLLEYKNELDKYTCGVASNETYNENNFHSLIEARVQIEEEIKNIYNILNKYIVEECDLPDTIDHIPEINGNFNDIKTMLEAGKIQNISAAKTNNKLSKKKKKEEECMTKTEKDASKNDV